MTDKINAANHIAVTRSNLKRLQAAHDEAVSQGLEQFTFDGAVLVTAYARYLLEYMRLVLGVSNG